MWGRSGGAGAGPHEALELILGADLEGARLQCF
jgi:hypothetical protein